VCRWPFLDDEELWNLINTHSAGLKITPRKWNQNKSWKSRRRFFFLATNVTRGAAEQKKKKRNFFVKRRKNPEPLKREK
jgi:hypothetical protein